MSNTDSSPRTAQSSEAHRVSLWVRELPYGVVLILAMSGVAYTSYLKQPIAGYWELLVPVIALMCVGLGWRDATDRAARLRLIWMQVLHWIAFLVVMNLLFLPSVQQILTPGATGLAVLSLLALGTFTAGVQVHSWQVCALGIVMALGVPAIAWIERSSLIAILIVIVVLASGAMLWWRWHKP
jgi:hypothetical protein